MRKLVFFTLLAAAAAYPQQTGAPKQAPSKAKKLTRAELDNFLAHPEQVLFIDVRRPDEVSSNGGFPVYLSIQAGELEKHLPEIPKDRVIVTVSNHAARAGRAADLLESKGFKVAGAAGVEDYESEGGKVVTIEVPKPSVAAKQ
ncbi:MAG: rhodanese-like domain-containing protein [Acidobacteriia bacterium]|nr:rhodanese-like domain-containing protein [Terriglobia bacterium]